MCANRKNLPDGLRVDPLHRRRHRLLAAALHLAERLLRRRGRQLVVERVEPLAKSGLFSQHVGGHETARGEARVFERVLDEALPGFHAEADVVAHAMLERQLSREHRRVGGKRLRRMGVGVLEQDALRRERVDVRRARPRAPVGRDAIGAQCVDGDDHDRAVHPGGSAAARPPDGEGDRGRRDDRRDDQERPLAHRFDRNWRKRSMSRA